MILLETLQRYLINGWVEVGETWTYSSIDDPLGIITITGDYTTKYSIGGKIRFVNGGNTIYGIICDTVTYSAPNTTIKFIHEIDETDGLAKTLMANSAITSPYYSSVQKPYGFPIRPVSWTWWVEDTSSRDQASPVDDTVYNMGSVQGAVPIGRWWLGFEVVTDATKAAAGNVEQDVALSTSNNSMSNAKLKSKLLVTGATRVLQTTQREVEIAITTKTTYYLVASAISSLSSIKFRGDLEPTRIYARLSVL